jgi:hypothetical protein
VKGGETELKDKRFYFIIGVVVFAIIVGGVLGGLAIYRNNDANRHSISITIPGNVADNFKNFGSLNDNTLQQGGMNMLNNTLESYLNKLVENGKITQEQADQLKSWWESKPDIPEIFSGSSDNSTGFFGMMRNGDGFNFGFNGNWSK